MYEDIGTLVLQVRPLECYKGSGLKTIAGDHEDLETKTGEKVLDTWLYPEIVSSPSNNSGANACINEC